MLTTYKNMFLFCVAAASLLLRSSAIALGDVLVEDFNLIPGNVFETVTPVPSVGQVTFSLNANGTIAASLTSSVGIVGFGFDRPIEPYSTPESISGGSIIVTEWATPFGTFDSGFYNQANTSLGSTLNWTIGFGGEFTSVHDALGGGNAITDFFLFGTAGVNAFYVPGAPLEGNYGAGLHTVPEPSSFALLGLGGIGFALQAFRRRSYAAV